MIIELRAIERGLSPSQKETTVARALARIKNAVLLDQFSVVVASAGRSFWYPAAAVDQALAITKRGLLGDLFRYGLVGQESTLVGMLDIKRWSNFCSSFPGAKSANKPLLPLHIVAEVDLAALMVFNQQYTGRAPHLACGVN